MSERLVPFHQGRFGILIVTVVLSMVGCSPSDRSPVGPDFVSRVERVPYFSSLRLLGNATVVVDIGPLRSVTIEGRPDQANGVTFDMRSDELQILTTENSVGDTTRPTVRITAPDTMALRLTGTGDIILSGTLRRPDFEIYNAGTGTITVTTGTVDLLAVRILRSGKVDAVGLMANQVHARIDGKGRARVTALTTINTDNTGPGLLEVYGHPKERSLRVQGSRTPPVKFRDEPELQE